MRAIYPAVRRVCPDIGVSSDDLARTAASRTARNPGTRLPDPGEQGYPDHRRGFAAAVTLTKGE